MGSAELAHHRFDPVSLDEIDVLLSHSMRDRDGRAQGAFQRLQIKRLIDFPQRYWIRNCKRAECPFHVRLAVGVGSLHPSDDRSVTKVLPVGIVHVPRHRFYHSIVHGLWVSTHDARVRRYIAVDCMIYI